MAIDADSMIEIKVVQKDGEGDPITATMPLTITLGQFLEWLENEANSPLIPEGTLADLTTGTDETVRGWSAKTIADYVAQELA